MMTDAPNNLPLEYAHPQVTQDRSAIASMVCGAMGIGMNGLLWEGAFAGETIAIPLTAACVTAALPIAGLIFFLAANHRHWLTWAGATLSVVSAGISTALLIYFLNHLPTC